MSWRREFNVVPVWTEVVADLETPVSTYMKLVQGRRSDQPLVPARVGGARPALGTLLVRRSRPVPGDDLARRNGRDQGRAGQRSGRGRRRSRRYGRCSGRLSHPLVPELPPFTAGAVGFLGYDVVRYLEKLPQTTVADVATPEMMLIFPRTVFVFDHLRQKITVVTNVVGAGHLRRGHRRAHRAGRRLGEPLSYTPAGCGEGRLRPCRRARWSSRTTTTRSTRPRSTSGRETSFRSSRRTVSAPR